MHFFNEKVAEELGVNAAIIFQNIGYWEEHNRNNNMHLHDGKYWTYNSNAAFQKQFSYLGKKAIQTAIEKLKESGYILIGNYNDNTWDHTSWYTLTQKGQSIYQNETIDGAKRDNRQTEKEQSYNNNYNNSENTNRNTDNNTDNKEEKEEPVSVLAKKVIDYLNAKCNKRFTVKAKGSYDNIKKRVEDCEATYEDFVKVIDVKYDKWHGTEWEQYLRPTTLFGNKFINYLNEESGVPPHEEKFESYRNDRE